MYYHELLEILEEMSEEDLRKEVTVESELIGVTKDIEFDDKSFTIMFDSGASTSIGSVYLKLILNHFKYLCVGAG